MLTAIYGMEEDLKKDFKNASEIQRKDGCKLLQNFWI